MRQQEKYCCVKKNKKSTLISSGILLGTLPHFFCVAFILFSIIGAATASAFLKKFLLIPGFFSFLVIISLLLATIFSAIYLKRNECLCVSGIKNKWKYLSLLYSTTILANLLMFFVVLPALANVNFRKAPGENAETQSQESQLSELTLNVQMPCSGHASLIINEIKKN